MSDKRLTDEQLLRYFDGMYSDGDADIRCYSARVVRTRTSHKCPGNFREALHEVAAGSRMIRERALVYGNWSTAYTCEECVVAWAKQTGELR